MRQIIVSTALAFAVFATAPAHAAESLTGRVVIGLSGWIAAQGNQALADLKKDMQDQLTDHLRPLLPPVEKAKQVSESSKG